MKIKLDYIHTLWAQEVADLFGISRSTFYRRWGQGYYEIHRKLFVGGFRYSMVDVFKILYPTASNKEIEGLIVKHNATKLKKRRKTRGKTNNGDN